MDKGMSKEKINQIIGEVYESFMLQNGFKYENGLLVGKMGGLNQLNVTYWLTEEEFINKCKTNPEFSERWELKIEERELSLEERWCLLKVSTNGATIPWDRMAYPPHKWMDNVRTIDSYDKDFNLIKGSDIYTPRKLITLIYKENKIESYE